MQCAECGCDMEIVSYGEIETEEGDISETIYECGCCGLSEIRHDA